MASGAGNQLHSPLVPLVNSSTQRYSGQHAKAKLSWRKSERVLELISTCVQGAFRVSPWEDLSEVVNDHVVEKVLPIDSEQYQAPSQQQTSHQDYQQEPTYSVENVQEAPIQTTTPPLPDDSSSNLAPEYSSEANGAKSGNHDEEGMSGSCATISQLLDEAEDKAPETNVVTQDGAEDEQGFHSQAVPPNKSPQQSPAPKPQLPSSSTFFTKSPLDTQQRKPISPRGVESRATSESPMRSTSPVSVTSTPSLKRNRSMPLNLSTDERQSLQVGEQELSAIQLPPQAHHLYSQSVTIDADSMAPSMADQKKGQGSLETKFADSSLSPSVTSPSKKRPYQKTSIWNLSPADFGYTANELEPERIRSKKKGKGSSMATLSSRSGSGAGPTSSLASLAAAHSSKPKTRSAPRRQVSFTSSTSSSLLEGNMEDIEGYVGEDLDGFENRLSY
ncbi:MAG: hypothetical protein BYD32DRAFT_463019 [Podila humilis]|nr:MAG: hypothetical protein BYD32DRAFT_463019 [Podila humilis]